MKDMRRIKKPLIKLGKIGKASSRILQVKPDSRRILDSFSPRSQRVVVKVKQSYNNSVGSWRAHGRYPERDVTRSGDGFSKTEDSVEVATTLHAWQEQGDAKFHKIILSPEYSERIELKDYAREVMAHMERDLGRSIEWVAVLHKNTDNHHAHIAVRGVDGEGKSLDIEEYLGGSLRERSRELITRKLGPRLYTEILKKRETELFANRLTDIDRALLWKADGGSIVHIPQQGSQDWQPKKPRNKTAEHKRRVCINLFLRPGNLFDLHC
jgi:type IV secretory pathway VirD2 relaxase